MDCATTLAHFELKYCERCGGLWLRRAGTPTPYCPGCERFMDDLPLRAVNGCTAAPARPAAAPSVDAQIGSRRWA